MFPMQFDVTSYLNRIGLDQVELSLRGLSQIQSAQLRSLVFEDIDPLLGTTPSLDIGKLSSKILISGRGGYCFELNKLLETALKTLGFDVERSLARVRMGADVGGPRSHLVLRVTIGNEEYLVDAGFGGPGSLVPLSIWTESEQKAPNGTYRISPDQHTDELVDERRSDNGWFPLFGFDCAHVGDADIEAANHLCATWSKMPFSNNLMANGFDGDTRIGIFRRAVTVDGPDGQRQYELADARELHEVLTGRFGLEISANIADAVWVRMFGAEAVDSSGGKAA